MKAYKCDTSFRSASGRYYYRYDEISKDTYRLMSESDQRNFSRIHSEDEEDSLGETITKVAVNVATDMIIDSLFSSDSSSSSSSDYSSNDSSSSSSFEESGGFGGGDFGSAGSGGEW
jgi:hypothetical protein